ncbi:cyclase family protein [Salinibacterium sp. TMP30]|uniref:cyclase family protein n=1 Tax=Salinibacterium sp. TMP30 TaxID=3138237 RepID=UPI0031387673
MYSILDLTHPVVTGMPVYPGDPTVEISTASSVDETGFAVASLRLGTHSGTHIDAPSHRFDGAGTIDEAELGLLFGPAVVLSVPEIGAGQAITVSHVRDQLESVRPNDIVFIATGWSSHYGSALYLDHPYLAPELGEELLNRGVRVLGVDLINPDPDGEEHNSVAIHDLMLGSGGYIVENLTNLGRIDWTRPLVSLLPLRLAGLDGSPIRAVAIREKAS